MAFQAFCYRMSYVVISQIVSVELDEIRVFWAVCAVIYNIFFSHKLKIEYPANSLAGG